MIIVTTCRSPGRRLRSFANDLADSLPDAVRVNRGKQSIEDLAANAARWGADLVIIIGAWRGNPGRLLFMKITEDGYQFAPPFLLLAGVKLLREMSEQDRPPSISTEIVATAESSSVKVKELGESLAELFKLPYIEVSAPEDLRGSADVIMWVEDGRREAAAIKFLNGRSLKPAGPLIRIRRISYEVRLPRLHPSRI